ncbi:hypothetical protein LSS_20920 [Leptospira santarosai serovar Shermani str. LT 821]|uniref:Uncharacterized protein n=1 Tax=Leptospira santarosai serovar Shermani str. LT 821 TaxID=758847 RepID=A0A097ESA7_9LEPT|nr:hypothetical protein LSS_20920 [Leptospira santarosai serovar Shermani str. LT 821]
MPFCLKGTSLKSKGNDSKIKSPYEISILRESLQ